MRRLTGLSPILFAICFAAAVCRPASAGELQGPFWVQDSIHQMEVLFVHPGPITGRDQHIFRPTTGVSVRSPHGFWEFFQVRFDEHPGPGLDSVFTNGSMFRHLVGPHEKNAGDPFSFSLSVPLINPMRPPGGFLYRVETEERTDHLTDEGETHHDFWRAFLGARLDANNQIRDYILRVEAQHVPVTEPASFGLLGLGLLGLAAIWHHYRMGPRPHP
ncbi:PEP-CTERM sorting domain-containing protein [Sabulicella rubraurantiaca]|uniref:PEP-CTERM sorting domain-containing protein n=1 Tax=Sabulicella rubraurantiaca TaxID=2811429 RepID=UPI001A959200|nr:PEP-CTERM sorting domain-containing protein [Sabulicella rubraurantiaca]